MLKNTILFLCIAVFAIGCDRISQQKISDTLIPRSVLQANPDKFCVTMSLQGDKIAYLARKSSSKIELRVEDLSGNLIRKFDVKEGLGAYDYCWATSGEHILIGQDEDGDENNHIICLDIKTGTSKDLTPFKARSFVFKRSKKYPHEIIVISNKRDPKWDDAYRVNIITGKTDLIFKNNKYISFHFDHDFNLRIASKMLPDTSVEDYLIKNGKPEFFRRVLSEDVLNTTFYHFNTDNKTIYGVDSIGRDKSAFVAYDLQNKTSATLFESDLADVGLFTSDPNTFAPQAFSVNYLNPEIFVVDKSISKDIAYLKSKSDRKYLDILERNYNDDTWLIRYYSSNSSEKYYLYKRDPKKGEPISLRFLFSEKPALDKYKLQEKIPVVIKSRDGLNLVSYLTKSYDFDQANPRKLVVYVHGGPWTRDVGDYFESMVQLLANRGYSVLQINYRGSTGFGKQFTNAANGNAPNGNLQKIRDDIIDSVNWAIANGIADKNNIAIVGGSFGGDMALDGITFTPDVFCCGINAFGGSNYLTFLETMPPHYQSMIQLCYRLWGDPRTEEGRQYLIENSPVTHAHRIKKPLLVFRGANDPRVHASDIEQIIVAMKERGLPMAYVVYPDEGHGCHKEANAKSYIAITELFLARIMNGRFEPIHPGELDGSSHQILEGKELIGLE